MIDLPDDILLETIKEANLYLDKKSVESTTQKTKRKYKLARSIILEQYLFNVLTRTKSSCKREATLTINPEDWENMVDDGLQSVCSYCDITKHDILDRDELLNKIKDKKNKFPYIAKLNRRKYGELKRLCKKAIRLPFISKATRDVIQKAMPQIYDGKLKELGID